MPQQQIFELKNSNNEFTIQLLEKNSCLKELQLQIDDLKQSNSEYTMQLLQKESALKLYQQETENLKDCNNEYTVQLLDKESTLKLFQLQIDELKDCNSERKMELQSQIEEQELLNYKLGKSFSKLFVKKNQIQTLTQDIQVLNIEIGDLNRKYEDICGCVSNYFMKNIGLEIENKELSNIIDNLYSTNAHLQSSISYLMQTVKQCEIELFNFKSISQDHFSNKFLESEEFSSDIISSVLNLLKQGCFCKTNPSLFSEFQVFVKELLEDEKISNICSISKKNSKNNLNPMKKELSLDKKENLIHHDANIENLLKNKKGISAELEIDKLAECLNECMREEDSNLHTPSSNADVSVLKSHDDIVNILRTNKSEQNIPHPFSTPLISLPKNKKPNMDSYIPFHPTATKRNELKKKMEIIHDSGDSMDDEVQRTIDHMIFLIEVDDSINAKLQPHIKQGIFPFS